MYRIEKNILHSSTNVACFRLQGSYFFFIVKLNSCPQIKYLFTMIKNTVQYNIFNPKFKWIRNVVTSPRWITNCFFNDDSFRLQMPVWINLGVYCHHNSLNMPKPLAVLIIYRKKVKVLTLSYSIHTFNISCDFS